MGCSTWAGWTVVSFLRSGPYSAAVWTCDHKSTDNCVLATAEESSHSIKVFSFIHPSAAFITEQSEKPDQVLAVQVYVSVVSGGTGALQGTVFSLR